jgi:heat shock protein HtpX
MSTDTSQAAPALVTDPARSPGTWILGRILLALGLMVGYYVFSIGIAVGLGWLGIAHFMGLITLPGRMVSWQLGGLSLFIAAMILWSLVPRPARFVPPGPRVDEKDQPRLFRVIREVADQTGQRMPTDVYVAFEMNACVTERGGTMGMGSSRVMSIGLPLLQYLTVPELKVLLTHEFAHYHGGDTKVGPWIYKTRSAIDRTVQSMGSNVPFMTKPFMAYGNTFLRVTHAVSRRQEYLADAMAARIMGLEHFRNMSIKVAAGSQAFRIYGETEVQPAVNAGYLPPVLEGFGRFLSTSKVTDYMSKQLADELASPKPNPYDTHPTLPARLEALGISLSPALPEDDAPRAITLLDAIEGLEQESLTWGWNLARKLERIPWDEVGPKVMLPWWKWTRCQLAVEMDGLTIGSLHALSTTPDALRIRFGYPPHSPEDVMRNDLAPFLGRAMKAALARNGWVIQTSPGEPVIMVSSKGRVDPSQLVRDVLYHKTDSAAWDRLCTEMDMGAIELGGCCGNPQDGEDLDMMLVDQNLQVVRCTPALRQKVEARVRKVFGEGGAGFSDRRLYGRELVVGPFLWDAIRRHSSLYGATPSARAKKCERRLLPLRLKRIDQARRPDGAADDVTASVICASFTGKNIPAATAALSDRYTAHGGLDRMTMRDLHLRSIPHWDVLVEPMFVVRLGDRRVFLQFDYKAKLIYVDDYSLRAEPASAIAVQGAGGS